MSDGRNLLLIATSSDETEAVATALRLSKNCNVTEVVSQDKALAYIRAFKYDLVIVTALYVRRDPLPFLEAIVKSQPQTPAVLFTSDDGAHEIRVSRLSFPAVRRANLSELLAVISKVMGWEHGSKVRPTIDELH